jgi:hypothetical protein
MRSLLRSGDLRGQPALYGSYPGLSALGLPGLILETTGAAKVGSNLISTMRATGGIVRSAFALVPSAAGHVVRTLGQGYRGKDGDGDGDGEGENEDAAEGVDDRLVDDGAASPVSPVHLEDGDEDGNVNDDDDADVMSPFSSDRMLINRFQSDDRRSRPVSGRAGATLTPEGDEDGDEVNAEARLRIVSINRGGAGRSRSKTISPALMYPSDSQQQTSLEQLFGAGHTAKNEAGDVDGAPLSVTTSNSALVPASWMLQRPKSVNMNLQRSRALTVAGARHSLRVFPPSLTTSFSTSATSSNAHMDRFGSPLMSGIENQIPFSPPYSDSNDAYRPTPFSPSAVNQRRPMSSFMSPSHLAVQELGLQEEDGDGGENGDDGDDGEMKYSHVGYHHGGAVDVEVGESKGEEKEEGEADEAAYGGFNPEDIMPNHPADRDRDRKSRRNIPSMRLQRAVTVDTQSYDLSHSYASTSSSASASASASAFAPTQTSINTSMPPHSNSTAIRAKSMNYNAQFQPTNYNDMRPFLATPPSGNRNSNIGASANANGSGNGREAAMSGAGAGIGVSFRRAYINVPPRHSLHDMYVRTWAIRSSALQRPSVTETKVSERNRRNLSTYMQRRPEIAADNKVRRREEKRGPHCLFVSASSKGLSF